MATMTNTEFTLHFDDDFKNRVEQTVRQTEEQIRRDERSRITRAITVKLIDRNPFFDLREAYSRVVKLIESEGND